MQHSYFKKRVPMRLSVLLFLSCVSVQAMYIASFDLATRYKPVQPSNPSEKPPKYKTIFYIGASLGRTVYMLQDQPGRQEEDPQED